MQQQQRLSKMIAVTPHPARDSVYITCPACEHQRRIPAEDALPVMQRISRNLSRIRNGPNGKGVRRDVPSDRDARHPVRVSG